MEMRNSIEKISEVFDAGQAEFQNQLSALRETIENEVEKLQLGAEGKVRGENVSLHNSNQPETLKIVPTNQQMEDFRAFLLNELAMQDTTGDIVCTGGSAVEQINRNMPQGIRQKQLLPSIYDAEADDWQVQRKKLRRNRRPTVINKQSHAGALNLAESVPGITEKGIESSVATILSGNQVSKPVNPSLGCEIVKLPSSLKDRNSVLDLQEQKGAGVVPDLDCVPNQIEGIEAELTPLKNVGNEKPRLDPFRDAVERGIIKGGPISGRELGKSRAIRKVPMIRGTGAAPANLRVKVRIRPQPRVHFLIAGLEAGMLATNVVEFLREKSYKSPGAEEVNAKLDGTSFHIWFKKEEGHEFDSYLDPKRWPSGLLIRRFFTRFGKETLVARTTTNSSINGK